MTNPDAIPWWEDEALKRKAAVGFASLFFLGKAVVNIFTTGQFTPEGWIDAIFGVGVGFDSVVEIVKRLRRGRDPDDPALEIIPAATPAGVQKARLEP